MATIYQILPPESSPVLEYEGTRMWIENVDPDRARSFLDTYDVNYRKLRTKHADNMTRDMEEGRWGFDGSPLRFDSNGHMIDGQHRSTAVIRSGTTQRFLVVVGLSTKAYESMDSNLVRRFSDLLTQEEKSNATARQALTNLIGRWQIKDHSLDNPRVFTRGELSDLHKRNEKEIARSVELALSLRKKIPMPTSILSFALWLLRGVDETKAMEFFYKVAEGEQLSKGDAPHTLRERLRLDRDIAYGRMQYLWLILSSWNAYVEGRKIAKIPIPSAISRERLPKPVDPQFFIPIPVKSDKGNVIVDV